MTITPTSEDSSHSKRKQRRLALGMTEAELSREIGEKPSVLKAYEAGQVSFVDRAITGAMEIALYRRELAHSDTWLM